MAPVEHVVADAGAFLRGAPLQEIGRNIYTIREVVTEIRDKETRQRLAVLPYQLHFKQPFPEYVRLGEPLLCFRIVLLQGKGDFLLLKVQRLGIWTHV
uniref:Ribonuclease PIN domain-containing protein n=1 Tax=Varanus komodoensis TaxID=61221 RepID=A0A8D2JF65_VARKO